MYTINSKYTKNQHIEKGLTTTIIMPSTKSTTRSSTSKHQQLTVRTSHKKDATAVVMKDDTNSTTPTGTGSSTTTFSNRVTQVSVSVPSKNNSTGSSHRNDAVSTSTNATVTNSTATNITTISTTKPPSSLPTLSSKGMIRQWLNEIELDADLDVVCDAFENAGIDTPHALISLDPSYHYDALHITSSNDKRKLFFLIQRIKHLLVQQEQAQAQEQVVTDESQVNEHEGDVVAVAGNVVRTTGAVTTKGNNRNKNDTTGNCIPISKQSLSKQLSSKSMNVLKENFYPSSTSISTLGITTGSVPVTGTTVSKFNDVTTTTTTTTATNAQPQQRKLMKSASQLLEDVLNDSASTTATTSKIKSGTPNVSTTTTTSKSPRGNYSRGSVTPKNSSSHTIFFINSYSISLSAILVTFTHTYIIHQSKREIWMFAADDGQRFYLFE
jgi:hypothetical protein